MLYKLEYPTLDSRRGKYNVVSLINNPVMWTPEPLNPIFPRNKAVVAEVAYAEAGNLANHPYWADEPLDWILVYQDFYNKLFSLDWLHRNEDRHSIVVSAECCLTLVQYHNHRLIAYSRSTDMRNGYYSDKIILDYLAEYITQTRPDCRVSMIEWHLALPHVYEKTGIARMLNEEVKE